MRHLTHARAALAAVLGLLLVAPLASAQSLGTFTWQVQPYCNVVTLQVTQVGGTYRLEGYDDQCGAPTRASVIGTAFQNPDGSIGLGFNIVAAPGGAPVHIDATISLPSLGGTWRDSAGNTGAFTASPVLPAGGAPRPVSGGIGASSINAGEVQRRVNGTCGPAELFRAVNQDGSVVCDPFLIAAGDITGVTAGFGLLGGAQAGNATLHVDFAGSGSQPTVAHADHDHRRGPGLGTSTALGRAAIEADVTGDGNTGVGYIALRNVTTGEVNTSIGARSLDALTSGSENTAVGASALGTSTTASGNTAVGYAAAFTQLTGNNNTALGNSALREKTIGNGNTAIGFGALRNLATGGDNIALGVNAGILANGGSSNILIGNSGVANENFTIRLGSAVHSATYIRGIDGAAVDGATDSPVLIDANHRLGTITSSARFKQDIESLTPDGLRLHALRPVSFRYLPGEGRGNARQFGLIAEEVAETMPELVVHDAEGKPFTVRYHQLPPLMLAEIQRLERERATQAERLDGLERELAALRSLLEVRERR
jgi:hypothetical protein